MKTSSTTEDQQVTRSATITAIVVVALAVGGIALLSSAIAGTGKPAGDRPVVRSTTTSNAPSPPPSSGPVSEPRGIEIGAARADDAAGDATTVIEPVGAHDRTGAVEVFVSYATWAIASPAAAADPLRVSQHLGGSLNMGDAAMIDAIGHDGLDITPSMGAYRVLGHSGSENAPDQVMLEFVAPMKRPEGILWRKIGGVVAWNDGRWAPTSMQPRDVPQPADLTQSVASMPDEERTRLLDGLGWALFSNTKG